MRKFRVLLALVFLFFCGLVSQARMYAVCVGVNKYLSPNASDLYFAESDASRFATFLKDASPDAYIYLLNGRNASRDAVLKAMNDIAARATENDVVMFYYSGHGTRGGMLAYESGYRNNPYITYRDLSNIFKKSKVRNKIIFADTCHSGSGELTNESNRDSQYLANQNILLFLSSRANENSQEDRRNGIGLFTRFVLDGLNGKADANSDKAVTARELFDYVSPNVIRETRGEQHPQMWGNFDPNLILIWLND